jgi:hypothetical protein
MASVTTRDHEEIRNWAEEHGAAPAVVSRTGGMLRFEFDTPAELAEVSWDDFFDVFDERGLELVYDDKPGSRFHKLVYPEAAAARKPARRAAPITPIQSARGRSRTAGSRGAVAARGAAIKARGSRPTASSTRPKSTRTAKATKAKRSAPRAPRKAA